jgi:LuxR family maltose regulon positive regulatory protein
MTLRFQQKLLLPVAARPLVARDALVARLGEAISTKRVVVLAAPAGWGKTTALTQWAARAGMPVAWYSLDSGDGDPRVFLDYLLHSCAAFVSGAGDLVARLSAASHDDLAGLFNDVALAIADAPAPFALVLDDFHTLNDELLPGRTPILSLLASIAEYAPHCHLVIASRTVPALHGMVRLIARQLAAVFDYTALQFSPDDVRALAALSAGIALPDETADALAERFSGWATGIALALDQAVQGGDGPPVTLGDDVSQVYAFFAEQIIAPLPLELQQFLEDTSVLEDLSPQLCDALRGASDSASWLDEVKRYGLFYSTRAGWLAYHSLFREFLRSRLARRPERFRALLRRAGELYQAADELERALNCYLAAGAEDDAIRMLQEASPRFRRLSRQTTLLACYDRLAEARAARPAGERGGMLPAPLLLAQARVYGDLAEWERARVAVQLVEAIGTPAERDEARILAAQLHCLQGQPEQARAVLAQVDPAGLDAALRLEFQYVSGGSLSLLGDVPAAISALEYLCDLAATVNLNLNDDDSMPLARAYDMLGWAYATQSRWSEALRYLQRADACWQASGNTGRRAATLNNLGMVAMADGRFEQAREAFETGLTLARQAARRREEAGLLCSLADLDLATGALSRVLERFGAAYRLAVRYNTVDTATAAAGALWAAALLGEWSVAEEWRAALPEIHENSLARARAALARALLAASRQTATGDFMAAELATAAEVEGELGVLERACLALLRAADALPRGGWRAAEPFWRAFCEQAAVLPSADRERLAALFPDLRRAAETAERRGAHRLAPAEWHITALGEFRCTRDGVACELSPLHRAVLVRLLDVGPGGLAVNRLWEDVWGNSHLSMPAVHMALSRLRSQTHLELRVQEGAVAIRTDWAAIRYDVREFEQLVRAPLTGESCRRLMELYRGEFLPGAPLSAALWADGRRADLQHAFLAAIEGYADRIADAEITDAIRLYQQILQTDPCREQTAAKLMRLAARAGQRALVNATFDRLQGALRLLGVAPAPSTAALYQQLR